MKIAVVGSGYVGLVASAYFANIGHRVMCLDCDAAKIARLSAGELPIYEPGLDTLVVKGLRSGALHFSTDVAAGVAAARIIFIAVGTPSDADGKPDLTNVLSVASTIGAALRSYSVIVTKSTVPVGTGDQIESVLTEHRPPGTFDVVSNPEFLREGRALHDFAHPDRIVIGAATERARAIMGRLYRPDHFGRVPILFTDRRTAELMKYASNAFLASKVAFINSVADLCERVGANIEDVARGMGLDARIGRDFLLPGPGFGGSCLPKDTRALVWMAKECGAPRTMFGAIVDANEARKRDLVRRVVEACGGSVMGKDIALLGLAFKANTDDIRESPALALISGLQERGARVRAYDPAGMRNAAAATQGVTFTKSAYACAAKSNAVVLVTDWLEFRQIDWAVLREQMADPIVVDLRNLYRPEDIRDCGIEYVSIGRETARDFARSPLEFGADRIVNDVTHQPSLAAAAFHAQPPAPAE